MKKVLIICLSLLLISKAAYTIETNRDAASMAKSIVISVSDYYKEHGVEKTIEEVSRSDSKFKDKELYAFLINYNTGVIVAHGVSSSIVGRNLINIRDTDGSLFLQDMIDIAKNEGEGWVDYKWPNPITKKVEEKRSFIKKLSNELLVGSGYYK